MKEKLLRIRRWVLAQDAFDNPEERAWVLEQIDQLLKEIEDV